MILQKLVEYYDRLEADPEEGIAPYGFSRQKISFVVVLNVDGSLHEFYDERQEDGKRSVPRLLVVPGQAKPSGSGINPGFLWDNAQYMLGFKPDDPKPKRTLQAFEAFRDRHLALEDEIDDVDFSVVCKFLRTWTPDRSIDHDKLAEITVAFGVFQLAGKPEFIHERPKVRAYCLQELDPADDNVPQAPSLISGDLQPIARLHEPKIKGVRGAQTSGATLVSFNEKAYESYGKSQGNNAPVGVVDAFKYATALNRLTLNRKRQVHLGDTTVVYWAEKPAEFEDELQSFFEPQPTTHNAKEDTSTEKDSAEDKATLDNLKGFFSRLRRVADGASFDDDDTPFYVLGLSPNAARISIRFWMTGTVQQFAERLGQHLADLELAGAASHWPPISLQRIIDQTARERDDIQPLLAGSVLRAILHGGPYPTSLASAVLRRIRADRQTGGVNGYIRAAILKAYLVRKARLNGKKEEITMTLDQQCPHTAYQLGRLFAVLEKTQEEALGGDLNVTIKDRYFSSASANPVTAFPRLLRLHAHHLDKLGTEKRGLKIVREKLVQEICTHISAINGFPTHLPLDDQGRFFIGYYHQRQDFFPSKKSEGETNNTTIGADSVEEE